MTLEQWKQQWDLTSREAARVLGIGQQTVNDLCSGVRSPGVRIAFLIQERTRTKDPATMVHAWELLTPEERLEIFGRKGRP
jgi:hypothetical protein